MKRLIVVYILLQFVLGVYSQEFSSRQRAQFFSCEVHEDKTVTFRLKAPKAVKVEVTGDFIQQYKVEGDKPGKTKAVQMKETADNVWEYTTPVLKPELYSYSFVVDGLKINDPNNVFQLRNVGNLSNVFLVEGGRADLYKTNDVPHGTVSHCWYHSSILAMKRRLAVYTPAGYETSRKRYPVVYLLHGSGGDEDAWLALGRAAQIMDNLIAQGRAKPMIVVMTNGNPNQEAAPGESTSGFAEQPKMFQPHKDGDFEASFPDIVKFVDDTYRTIKRKSGRAICGLSMGGFHSLHISKEFPGYFDYVGLFSAGIKPGAPTDSPVFEDMPRKLKKQFSIPPKLYWMGIGSEDFLYKANLEYRKMLDDNGYKYTYYETDGGHTWKNWRIYLSEFIPLLF